MEALHKQGISDSANIDPPQVRKALKSIRMKKFYDQACYISFRITGRRPPQLSAHQEKTLICMFESVQLPYEIHKGKRKNFLSYQYTLYKLCELLGLHGMLPCFPDMKGRQKLKEADAIWERICRDLQWKFHPTKKKREVITKQCRLHVKARSQSR